MDLAHVFLTPPNATQRQYEALRAYFVEHLPGPEVARRFGYTTGSFHQLVHQVQFITLLRRSAQLLQDLAARPRSAWRRIELEGVSRQYKTPRKLDEQVTLAGYDGAIRQIAIADLGHEEPTLLLTNQLRRSATKLIERFARRMLIENNIEDGVNFFHLDALSSAVALKVNCDLQLTLMASSLYRYLGQQIGNGYEAAKSRHLFRDLPPHDGLLILRPSF